MISTSLISFEFHDVARALFWDFKVSLSRQRVIERFIYSPNRRKCQKKKFYDDSHTVLLAIYSKSIRARHYQPVQLLFCLLSRIKWNSDSAENSARQVRQGNGCNTQHSF